MDLITGASGFLGRHLVRYLSGQGVRARALFYSHPPSEELLDLPGIEWLQCDLLDVFAVEQAMFGIDNIYHCAAILTFDSKRRDEMLHFNPESTANIVNQALEQGVSKMVYVSSIAALGRSGEDSKEITEEQEWGESKYNSAYGVSKYLAEMEVWRGIGEGLNAVIVNPGIILGSGKKSDLAFRLMYFAEREFPFYSKGITSWVGATDLVMILARLMNSDISDERFIVSTGNLSYREIIAGMAVSLNKKPAAIYANKWMTGLAWRLSALKSFFSGGNPIITRETVNNANSICLYNNSKLLKALPDFSYAPIKESIVSMAQSFIEQTKK